MNEPVNAETTALVGGPANEPSVLAWRPPNYAEQRLSAELRACDDRNRVQLAAETARSAAQKRNAMIAWLAEDCARAHGENKSLRGRLKSERALRKQLQGQLAGEREALRKVMVDADAWSERCADAKATIHGLMLRIERLETEKRALQTATAGTAP
jgi:hypothetical protein